jgi:uncharacterized protein
VSDLTALALDAAHELPVAELHGAVCGLGVCHGVAVPIEDVVALLGAESLTDQNAVEAFVAASVGALEREDMGFAPLLPEDDAPLEQRLEALGAWCGAFLAGLAAGLARRGIGSLADCPEEVREIVADMAAISQIDPDAGGVTGNDSGGRSRAAAESEEADLVELEEFVKVGTLLIMTLLSREDDDDAGDPGH